MSRWESLKSDIGDEKGQRNNAPGLRRSNNRWASLNTNSNARHESSRQQHHNKASFRGRQQHQRHLGGDKSDSVASTKTEAVKNDKLSMLIAEHDTILNSLTSKLQLCCQSNDDDDEKSEAIQNLASLISKTTNISRLQTADEIPCNTDVFMELLHLLKSEEEKEDSGNLGLILAQTIESYLKVSETGGKTNSLLKIIFSKSQVGIGIATLSSQYNKWSVRQPTETKSPMVSSLLVSIALLTKNHVTELPPESTARNVVGGIFIPYLRQNQDPSTSTTTTHLKCVCEATIALLRNPSHASAILAPLVEDVSIQFNYVIEEQTINPLKTELLGALLKYMESPINDDTGQLECVCQTLSATIDGIRKLRKGNETETAIRNDSEHQIIKPLQKYILEVVSENNRKIKTSLEMTISFETLMASSLQLLRALIACYPKAMTGTGWKLIIEGANRNGNSTCTSDPSSRATSSYLPLFLGFDTTLKRSESQLKNMSLAMECIADFILVLPWNKWLKQSGPGNTTRNIVVTPTKAPTSGFYKSVVDALVSLIGITKKILCKCNEISQMNSLGRLMKTIMLEIPYCDLKLIRAGEDLWKEVTVVIIPGSQKYSIASSPRDRQNLAFEVLVASSGGTPTPQGYMRGMSPPAQTWFLSKNTSTKAFVDALLDSLESINGRFDQTVKILSSMLRTLPDIALQRWDAFREIFKELSPSSNRKELMRMEVLESFMLGRKDFEVSADLRSKNNGIIADLEGIMLLQGWNQNSLQRCMIIYSAFRSEDWSLLNQIDDKVSCHLDNILSSCQNSSAKIREGAARAVGEFCTQCVLSDDSSGSPINDAKMQQYRSLVHKVHDAMLKLCKDKNAGARSMSIFSLGNLSDALKGLNAKEIIDASSLYEMHKAILSSFGDTNDKVVKNAIRSVGHTSNLLSLSLRRESSDEHISVSYGLLVETIEALTSKLWKTLHVALNEEQKAGMTWKERSAAKKHGWGACHSLGLVFEGLWLSLFEDSMELAMACSKAVQCLVRCPCHHAVLNEKVVLAAMAAICQLPSEFLSQNEAHESVLGNALKTSILFLESESNNHRVTLKLTKQNEPFLLHLLNSASIADATIVLDDDRVTTQTLESLYSWMVEVHRLERLSALAFEVFALALQQQSASVAFEQKFTSRALQKRKQETIGKTNAAANSSINSREQNTNEEDEADEL